jgi:hypothetical protein
VAIMPLVLILRPPKRMTTLAEVHPE